MTRRLMYNYNSNMPERFRFPDLTVFSINRSVMKMYRTAEEPVRLGITSLNEYGSVRTNAELKPILSVLYNNARTFGLSLSNDSQTIIGGEKANLLLYNIPLALSVLEATGCQVPLFDKLLILHTAEAKEMSTTLKQLEKILSLYDGVDIDSVHDVRIQNLEREFRTHHAIEKKLNHYMQLLQKKGKIVQNTSFFLSE